MAKKVDFFDGSQTSTTPTIGNIVASDLVSYANDATYEANEQGAPAEGNIYYNTTDDKIRYYANGAWHELADIDQAQTLTNKTIDGTDATGTNTVTNDATDVSYDNTSSGLTATDAQNAIDEVEARVDTNEADIDDLETLSGSAGATDHGTFAGSTIPDSSSTKGSLQALETEVELKIDSSEKGAANGVATLDGSGKMPAAQLPDTALTFEGSFDASGGGSGSPSLTDGTGNTGDFYRVSAAGTVDHGAGNVTYAIGDSIIYNGSVWEKYAETTLADTDSLPEGSTNLYNQTHTGEVTGATALTVDPTAISNKTTVVPESGDFFLFSDTSDSGNLKKADFDELGSGSGQGGINYIINTDFEKNVNDTTTSANVSISQQTGLRGSFSAQPSFGTSATGADYVGFQMEDVDTRDLGKTLWVSFDYGTNVGVSTGDFEVYVRDVDGAADIELDSDNSLIATGGHLVGSTFTGRFTTDSTNNTYELRIRLSATFGSTKSLRVDNVRVGPDTPVPSYSENAQAHQELTADENNVSGKTLTDLTMTTVPGRKYRVVGQAQFLITDGGSAFVEVKDGATVLAKAEYNAADPTGTGVITSGFDTGVFTASGSSIIVEGTAATASRTINGNGTREETWAQLIEIFNPSISTTETLFQTARVVASSDAGTSISNSTTEDFIFEDVQHDPLGSYDTSTGIFTAPRSGMYAVMAMITITGTTAGTGTLQVILTDDSDTFLRRSPVDLIDATSYGEEISTAVYLNAGDKIKIRVNQTNGAARNAATNDNQTHLTIFEIPDFSVFSVFGETDYVESTSSDISYPFGAGSIGDLTSIVLTPGEWDISAFAGFHSNGSTSTTQLAIWFGTTGGSTTVDRIFGDRVAGAQKATASGSRDSLSITPKRVIVTEDTTYYLKAQVITSVTNLEVNYRLSARRIK